MRNDGVIFFSVIVELMPQNAAGNPGTHIYLAENFFVFDAGQIFATRTQAVDAAANFCRRIFFNKIISSREFPVIAVVFFKSAIEAHNV